LVEGWPKVVEYVRDQPNSPVTGDRRHDARGFIFEMIVTNRQYESGDVAAAVGSAIIWLATTALPGGVIELGVSYKRIHYEITDIDAANRDFKFSLMLG
jgi:hypothetical protein